MKICIFDWRTAGALLKDTKYPSGTEIDGTSEDAFRIARELFDLGLNVMVKRSPERNLGTKKNPEIEPEGILVAVDTYHFQQR